MYSQQFILLVTHEWAHWIGVFVPGKPFQRSVMKHSSLLCPFLSYKEKEIADILHGSYLQQFILLVTHEWAHWTGCCIWQAFLAKCNETL